VTGEAHPILVVAAVRQELEPLFHGLDGGVEVLLTGIGAGRALDLVQDRLARRMYRWVISTGFSGGLRSGFQVGDWVMASEVMEASTGRRWKPPRPLPELGRSVSIGRFVTVPSLLREPPEKQEAGFRFGAIAVDLETAAVATAASKASVPWIAFRAILDPMETALPISSRGHGIRSIFTRSGRERLKRFLGLIRAANRSLAEGLGRLILQINGARHHC